MIQVHFQGKISPPTKKNKKKKKISFSFHPVDAFFTFSPIYLAMINQIQISAQMYIGYILFFVHINLYMHSGYTIKIFDKFLSKIWITSSEMHNIHHEKSHCNFGEVSPLWDYLNSTCDKQK